MAKRTPKPSKKKTSPKSTQEYTDRMYYSYGAYTVLQVLGGLFFAASQNWSGISLAWPVYFAVLSWIFFTKQAYAQTVSRVTAVILTLIMMMYVFEMGFGFGMVSSSIGIIVYALFGFRVRHENGKGEGSIIFSGDEASSTSLRNYALLILIILGVFGGIWFWFTQLLGR